MIDGSDPTETNASGSGVIIKSLKRVYDGFLKIDEAVIDQLRADGTRQVVTRQSMERGDSVAVLVVDKQKRVVWLLRQFRFPTYLKGPGWIEEVPAGMPRQGESDIEAARRELAEETGFDIARLEHVSTFYVSPGGTSERIILYCAFVDGPPPDPSPGSPQPDADEDIELVQVPLDDFMNAARHGEIDDAKTAIGGLWLCAHRDRLRL